MIFRGSPGTCRAHVCDGIRLIGTCGRYCRTKREGNGRQGVAVGSAKELRGADAAQKDRGHARGHQALPTHLLRAGDVEDTKGHDADRSEGKGAVALPPLRRRVPPAARWRVNVARVEVLRVAWGAGCAAGGCGCTANETGCAVRGRGRRGEDGPAARPLRAPSVQTAARCERNASRNQHAPSFRRP